MASLLCVNRGRSGLVKSPALPVRPGGVWDCLTEGVLSLTIYLFICFREFRIFSL